VNIPVTVARDAGNRAGGGILPEGPAAPDIATGADVPRRAGVRVFAIIIRDPSTTEKVVVIIADVAGTAIDQRIVGMAIVMHFRRYLIGELVGPICIAG